MRTKAALKMILTYAIWIAIAVAVFLAATAAGGSGNVNFVRTATAFITGALISFPGLTLRRSLRKGASVRQTIGLGCTVCVGILIFEMTNIVQTNEQSFYKILTPALYAATLVVITVFFAYKLGKVKAGTAIKAFILSVAPFAAIAIVLPYYDVTSDGLLNMLAGSISDVTSKDFTGLLVAVALSSVIFIISDIEKNRSKNNAGTEAIDIVASVILAVIASFYCGIVNFVGIAAPVLALCISGNRFAGRNFFCGMTGGIIMVVSDMTEQLTGVSIGFVALAISGGVVVGVRLCERNSGGVGSRNINE